MSTSTGGPTRIDAGSLGWRIIWSGAFAIARRSGRILWMLARLRVPSYGREIVRIGLVGRKTGQPRPVLAAMIQLDGRRYVGNPNGSTAWLTNLEAMETVVITSAHQAPILVHPTPLRVGPERDAVIRASARRGPVHVRPLYWASRAHVLRSGVFFRLDPADDGFERSIP